LNTLSEGARTGATLVRHQLGALVATAVDFAVMISLVHLVGMYPARATALSALAGAVTNFTLSRRWVFDRHQGTVHAQALRYALVSLGSLLLNVAGEQLAIEVLDLDYVTGRVLVSLAVSILWNFPLHRRFVFSAAS
jgi:putative flippase GtrA